MIQKTYEIKSVSEINNIIGEISSLYNTGSTQQILLHAYAFRFSSDDVAEVLKPLCEAFPDMLSCGFTMFMAIEPELVKDEMVFDSSPLLRLVFYIFERESVRMIVYDQREQSFGEIVESAKKDISGTVALKGVEVLISGLISHVSEFLEQLSEGNEDIPIFGTLSDVDYVTNMNSGAPFVFCNGSFYENGAVLLLYYGEELHIEVKYVFGWNPIGKAMEVTVSDEKPLIGDTVVTGLDGEKPEVVLKKYFGIRLDKNIIFNSCEFPFVIERNGMLLGRTIATSGDEGQMIFTGSIRPGEKVRFSYTVPNDLLNNTERESREMVDFAPQAIHLYICGNRSMLLRRDGGRMEVDLFRRLVPDTSHCNAAGEIYFHKGKGGFLNSALVAVAFREGEKKELKLNNMYCKLDNPYERGIIPLSERLLSFLRAMSGDLLEYADQSERASRAKSAFLANMSHEIRTPINAVLGMNEMILRESEEEQTLNYANDIRTSGRTLLSLVNDILDFSKIEEGRMEIIPTQYDLSSVVNDLVNMISGRAEKKGLELNVHIDKETPTILFGDEIRIKQVVLNILTNAVKYTNEGEVSLDVSFRKTAGDKVSLGFKVSDTGIGIKEEDMDRLFAPFSRIEEKRNRSIEGTGLGMSIVKQLLDLMDSHLEVSSKYGEGSVFSFEISQGVVRWAPIGESAFGIHKEAVKPHAYKELFHAPDARILVVDDTEVNLTVFCNLLKKTGINIDTACSGAEAVRLSENNDYDVIFLDHLMPDMDGIETLQRIRGERTSKYAGQGKIACEPVCIALTANAVSGAREMYIREGFTDYLSKPIDGEKLEKLLLYYLPSEKVKKPEEHDSIDAKKFDVRRGPDENGALIRKLSEVSCLDTAQGLANCGSPEGYISVLRVFHQTAGQKADEIRELHTKGDIENYTIKVHALKSSARIIGAASLSEQARELEMAGKEGDLNLINKSTENLLEKYRELDDALIFLDEGAEKKPGLSGEMRKEAFQTMGEIAESMDFGMMEELIKDLKKYELSDPDAAALKEIENSLMGLDWDAIVSKLRDI